MTTILDRVHAELAAEARRRLLGALEAACVQDLPGGGGDVDLPVPAGVPSGRLSPVPSRGGPPPPRTAGRPGSGTSQAEPGRAAGMVAPSRAFFADARDVAAGSGSPAVTSVASRVRGQPGPGRAAEEARKRQAQAVGAPRGTKQVFAVADLPQEKSRERAAKVVGTSGRGSE